MSASVSDFWKRLAESNLLAPQQVQQLATEFSAAGNSGPASPKTAAQSLVNRKALSRYQAMVLLAGRSGPFFYGDYKVYDRVDKGRLAGAFRAVHVGTGHPVLLKFLTGPVVSQPQMWSVAASSVAAASRIISPHVQRYFEAVDLQAFKFFVGEDLRGSTADELIARGRVAPPEACRIVRLAALGLAQMHSTGRVHGEVRPANLLLESAANQPANVKVLFDANQSPGAMVLSNLQPGSVLSLMADYLAPELLTPGRACDPLTDIYALGCILYTLLAGQSPFAGGDVQQKLTRQASENPQPLESFGVQQPLAQLATSMLAKNPAARCQSALLVAEQLAAFVEPSQLYIAAPVPPSTLVVYQQLLHNKQASSVMPTWQPMGAPQPADGSRQQAPIAIQTDRDRFAAAAESTTRPAAAPTFIIDIPSKGSASRADEIVRRRKARQKRNRIMGLSLTGLAAVAAVVAGVIWWRNQQAASDSVAAGNGKSPVVVPTSASGNSTDSQQVGDSSATDGSASTGGKEAATGARPQHQVIADDGKSLWAAPTSGPPVSLRCVPPEGQVFLALRPAAMLASPEGRRVLAALGPTLVAARENWGRASGFKLDEIEQLLITLHNNEAKFPRASFVVRTNDKQTTEDLLAKWGNPSPVKEQSETYYSGSTWAYYIPRSPEEERTFAMGEPRDIKEVAAAAGAPPAAFREIERLRRTSDSRRHVTLLCYPPFFFNDDGELLFGGDRLKVREPLQWLLGEHLQAASVSVHFGDETYLEMRMLGSLDKEPYQLAEELRSRLAQIPTGLEDYIVSLDPPAYWKKLAFRYPGMIRELHAQARLGVEYDQAIVNGVLPATAAHNLVLGSELLVATTPGKSSSVASVSPASAAPKAIADALQVKTSYSFASQSLEFAMRDLEEDVKSNLKNAPIDFAIKIIGGDLEKDGITRNQSVRDFQQENQTVADILTALVRKANPVTTVKEPSEPDQKLVWVIGPDPDNSSKEVVLITTRAAAAAKKYKLPPVFVAKK